MKRIVSVYHLDAYKFLESDFINHEVFPLVWASKKQGYNYKTNLKKPKKTFFWEEAGNPKIEIAAFDKHGIKKEKFSITLLLEKEREALLRLSGR